MSKQKKDEQRPKPRLPRGLRDIEAAELRQQQAMLTKIREVYERYGFEPLETPAFEYTDALGKFLPDQDRPNEGVFSLQDEDEQWMSLRYDLTAPLSRYVAQHFQFIAKPFRRYANGYVFRNEKPGPGRFRQFMQFDADTVGTDSVAADAEMCMLAADTLEALGIKRGDYVIKVNSRKILEGVLESLGFTGPENALKRLNVMRVVDKFDRFEESDIRLLLGPGRKDKSGDFTEGANLAPDEIDRVWGLTQYKPQPAGKLRAATIGGSGSLGVAAASRHPAADDMESAGADGDVCNLQTLDYWSTLAGGSPTGDQGLRELQDLCELCYAAGYGTRRIRLDSSVVRGLEYYTGPVFEAEITREAYYTGGEPVRFGSVGGGGRYDDLVARFTGQKVPATGFSIGVSRLQAALNALNKDKPQAADGPVIVTVMEKERTADYQKFVQELRAAGIRAELYLGNPKKFGKQLEYADKRNSPCVVIQGSDEYSADPPQVVIKDLVEGAKAAEAIKNHEEWKEQRPAQVTVKAADLVDEVRKILARHTG
jgi:histidyl-tRNA synthetase